MRIASAVKKEELGTISLKTFTNSLQQKDVLTYVRWLSMG